MTAAIGVLNGCSSVPVPGPFEGQVIDNQSGSPIAGAEVEAESWCHDNPLPDGPGSFHVRSNTKTNESGFFRLAKETRRGGLFGCSFALKIKAKGYIPANILYEPKGIPLPPETVAYPFINTSALKEFPAKLEIRLAPAIPVFLKALKSSNGTYQNMAREELTRLTGVDYGYDVNKWEQAVASRRSGSVGHVAPKIK
jgi:hypothetical protein